MVDLTEGKPQKVLIKYALPLFGSVVFQQIYNIADSVIAGKFIGENALAAVGNSYEITLIFLAFAFGCNMGASILTAKNFGAKKYKDMKTAISTSFIATIIICAILMIVGLTCGEPLLKLLNTPDEIMSDSLIYLDIYTGGLIFLFLYNLSTGIFAALGDSKTPFIFLVVSSISNIGMDILFVAVFDMGVAGVAWATFICQSVSCILALITLFRQLSKIKLDAKFKLFSICALKEFFLVGIPSTLQQSFVSVGNILIQSIINSFGTSTIAGYSAAIKFNNFAVTSLCQLGNAVSNFSAQNLAIGKVDRVKQSFKWGIILATALACIFIFPYTFANRQIMLLFLDAESTEAIEVGHMFLTIVPPFYAIISIKLIADGILRGAEHMGEFMISTFTDLVIRVVLSFVLSKTSLGSTGIWISWPIGWIVAILISFAFYWKGNWKKKKAIDKK